MSWYSLMKRIHSVRDNTYKRAKVACESKGHSLFDHWTPIHSNRCRKCGMMITCHNIMAQTDAPDFTGAALLNDCQSTLEGGYFIPAEKFEHLNKPAKNTVI